MPSLSRMPLLRLLGLIAGLLITLPASAQSSSDLTGTWEFSVVTANGTGTPIVVLKQTGDSVSGTYDSPRGGLRQLDGTFKSGVIVFTVRPNDAGGTAYLFTGTLEADGSLSGTADFSGMGSATFSARKKPPAESFVTRATGVSLAHEVQAVGCGGWSQMVM